jgi:hypothetical protein
MVAQRVYRQIFGCSGASPVKQENLACSSGCYAIAVKRQSSAASFTHLSPSTAPFMEAPAAINVVAACQHAGV